MAAIMRHLRCHVRNYLNITKIVEPQELHVSKRGIKFLKSEPANELVLNEISDVDDTQQLAEVDEDMQQKRNKSRLYTRHRNLLYEEVPYSNPTAWYHNTVKYKRRMYGRYGEISGVNPGLMWPTRQELAETKEYEAVVFSKSIQEMISDNRQRKEEEESIAKARQDDILKKMAKLGQWKNEVHLKSAKKLADAQAAKERKDRLVEEVRRHFGFKVDPREDRFKEMLEQKEKAEKKSLKEAKKKAKEAKMITKLSKPASTETIQVPDNLQ